MPVPTISDFSQLGIAGIVIYLSFMFIKELRAINDSHNERHDKRNELHAAERREWLEVTREIAETLNTLAGQFEARLK